MLKGPHDDPFDIPKGTAYLQGKVTYNGRPVANAYVSMDKYKYRTKADGLYSLPTVESGFWTVAVWYNYRNYLQRVRLVPGTNRINFEVAQLYALYGLEGHLPKNRRAIVASVVAPLPFSPASTEGIEII